jgi:hypothetical protein
MEWPPPRPMTEEAIKRIVAESREWLKAFERLTKKMEEISGEDFQTRVR